MKKVLLAKQDKAGANGANGANGAKVENKTVEPVENNDLETIFDEGEQDETSEDDEQSKTGETWEAVVTRINSEASAEGIKIAENLAAMQSLYDSAPDALKPHLVGGLDDLKKEAGKISPEAKIKQVPGIFKIAIAGHIEGIMANLANEGLDPLRLEIIKSVLENGKIGSTGSTGGAKETKTHFVFTNEGKQYTSCGNSKSDRQILAEGITEAQWRQIAAKYPFKTTEKSTSGFKIEDGKKVYGNIATKAALSQIKNVLPELGMMWKVCEGDEKTSAKVEDIITFNQKEK